MELENLGKRNSEFLTNLIMGRDTKQQGILKQKM